MLQLIFTPYKIKVVGWGRLFVWQCNIFEEKESEVENLRGFSVAVK